MGTGYPDGPSTCEPPVCFPRLTNVRDAGFLIVFAFWGAVLLYWLAYFAFRHWRQSRHPSRPYLLSLEDAPDVNQPVAKKLDDDLPVQVASKGSDARLEVNEQRMLSVTGYRNTFFGSIGYTLTLLVSIQWIAIYVLILWDTYHDCQVQGIDSLCFFGDNMIFGTYLMNGKVFFTTWWLGVFWFVGYVINRDKVRNWFRRPADLQTATDVYVWTPEKREILTINIWALVRWVRKLKAALNPGHVQGHGRTLKVATNASGMRYFMFEGGRFIITQSGLLRASLSVGSTYVDLHEAAKGLESREAATRLDLVGPNAIPFKADPLHKIIRDESFSLFHVYQLCMYQLQLWNSYLFVASLDICIVVLSMTVTIFTTRRSQKAIEKVTKYKTEANALRDGRWTSIDAADLVPGDVVQVKSDWLLPCDLVILSGMATSKGDLLSTILYSPQMMFKYDEELPIVVTLLLCYAIVVFGISLAFQYHNGSQSVWVSKWIYCMAAVNQIMNPLLPVALEVGQVHAVERLKAKGIFCLNPKRIAISGKIRLFLFDKTGTLTRDGLDFLGVRSASNTTGKQIALQDLHHPAKGIVSESDSSQKVLWGCASCHAVTRFGEQLVGNQVEVKMFEATGWQLIETPHEPAVVQSPSEKTSSLTILKVNEFDHGRMTMSVIVKDNSTGELHVFCKGSFERIGEICSSKSLPAGYTASAKNHALEGCYVLSLAHKSLGKVRPETMVGESRDKLESNLSFISLLIFRNELKPDTHDAIVELKSGHVRPVMVTGDNAQCGHYIAKASGMIAADTPVLLGDIAGGGTVAFTPMGPGTDGDKGISAAEVLELHGQQLRSGQLELAVTGKAFAVLQASDLMQRLLFSTRIYARFTPEQKVEAADLHCNAGLVVAMCGDGGNDCGALRAAHAGIALSDAEASVVSPFTSKSKSVASTVDLVKEGRAALHTSFACYKFLITYGLLFSILKLNAYWFGIILCQMDYIMIDAIAVLSLGYSMTLSHPAKSLAHNRPTSSLLGPLNFVSVVGVWLINLFFITGALKFMSGQPFYLKWPAVYAKGADWWTLSDNVESTVIFFVIYFQFITAAFIFTFGSTFRRPVYFNVLTVAVWFALMVFTSFLLLLPPSGFTDVWHVASRAYNAPGTDTPAWQGYQEAGGLPSPAATFSFRFRLWWLILGNLVIIALWQKVVAEGPVTRIVAKALPSTRPKFNY